MSRPFRLAGIIAGIVLIVFGIGAIVIGISGRHEVSKDVKREQIVGTPDMKPALIAKSVQEAGLKNVAIKVSGENAYGYLKAENGVHRLVRISPFDANARRQTSFASVTVYPEVDDDIVIDIPEKDVRVDVYRASGAGGQKVNKTSSAVRLTHVPTGITVAMQNERSQHANRDMAWKILRSRLYDLEMQKRNQVRDEAESLKKDIAFGSQIRSYVLAPYRLVKDLRTGVETGNVDAVLDGKLDDFVTAQLLGVKNPNRAVPE